MYIHDTVLPYRVKRYGGSEGCDFYETLRKRLAAAVFVKKALRVFSGSKELFTVYVNAVCMLIRRFTTDL